MNKMFSTVILETKDNKKISSYMDNSIKNIEFREDFKPIFEKAGAVAHTKKELLQMKTNQKGTTFKDIGTITVVNVRKDKNILNGKDKQVTPCVT